MQSHDLVVDAAIPVESVSPVVETVLAAIQADAVVDAVQYLSEVVTHMDGE
jgi:formylmethanofuran:tetrahydromethanopterin formyltransferase